MSKPTRYGAHRWTLEQMFERTTPNQASHQLARDLILARTRIFELESAQGGYDQGYADAMADVVACIKRGDANGARHG